MRRVISALMLWKIVGSATVEALRLKKNINMTAK